MKLLVLIFKAFPHSSNFTLYSSLFLACGSLNTVHFISVVTFVDLKGTSYFPLHALFKISLGLISRMPISLYLLIKLSALMTSPCTLDTSMPQGYSTHFVLSIILYVYYLH